MSLKQITLYYSGWKCSECGVYNKGLPFYSYKCGDEICCQRCGHKFLIYTMSVNKDPYLMLEKQKKELQISMDKLVRDFHKQTGIVPTISTDICNVSVNISIGQKPNCKIGEEDDLSD